MHRHRRRAAQARHEPRRSARHQPQGDGAGRRRHQEIRAGRLRHLHHQSARRDGLGAAEVLGPAEQPCRRHGRRARLARASAISSPRSSRSRSRTSPPSCSAAMATPWCRWPATRPLPAFRCPTSSRWAGPPRRSSTQIIQRTRDGGAEIVGLLKTGSAYLRAGRVGDRDGREPTSRTRSACCPAPRYLTGQYGVKDIYVGVPVVIGAGGVERIIEIDLNKAEQKAVRQVGRLPSQALCEACIDDRAEPRLEVSPASASRSPPHEHPRIPGQGSC